VNDPLESQAGYLRFGSFGSNLRKLDNDNDNDDEDDFKDELRGASKPVPFCN
jgi:hypothetical protein